MMDFARHSDPIGVASFAAEDNAATIKTILLPITQGGRILRIATTSPILFLFAIGDPTEAITTATGAHTAKGTNRFIVPVTEISGFRPGVPVRISYNSDGNSIAGFVRGNPSIIGAVQAVNSGPGRIEVASPFGVPSPAIADEDDIFPAIVTDTFGNVVTETEAMKVLMPEWADRILIKRTGTAALSVSVSEIA